MDQQSTKSASVRRASEARPVQGVFTPPIIATSRIESPCGGRRRHQFKRRWTSRFVLRYLRVQSAPAAPDRLVSSHAVCRMSLRFLLERIREKRIGGLLKSGCNEVCRRLAGKSRAAEAAHSGVSQVSAGSLASLGVDRCSNTAAAATETPVPAPDLVIRHGSVRDRRIEGPLAAAAATLRTSRSPPGRASWPTAHLSG